MLSIHPPGPSPLFIARETVVRSPRHAPAGIGHPPSPRRPTSTTDISPPTPHIGGTPARRPASELLSSATKLPTHEVEALDQWFENLQKYEATLEEMAAASVDVKFKEELGTIEHWFKILSEPERTATLYSLLQHSSQLQIRFFIAVLQQMARSDGNNPLASSDVQTKNKFGNRNLRPPSLNLPIPGSPSTPHFDTPCSNPPPALGSVTLRSSEPSSASPAPQLGQILERGATGQDVVVNPAQKDFSWASMVHTPVDRMFQKESSDKQDDGNAEHLSGGNHLAGIARPVTSMPGLPVNPFNMSMLGAMGLSTEAQLLAVQMVMGGYVHPGHAGTQPQTQRVTQPHLPPLSHPAGSNNWRAPGSARYPGSALRSSGPRSGGPKSSGLRSSGLKSASSLGSTNTPREEEIDPELLNDIPAWLKSLRLHKYTSSFDGLTWQDMVVLDESNLEARGISALGARRRLLKTFNIVKKKMGMECPSSTLLIDTHSPSTIPSSSFPSSTTDSGCGTPQSQFCQTPHSGEDVQSSI